MEDATEIRRDIFFNLIPLFLLHSMINLVLYNQAKGNKAHNQGENHEKSNWKHRNGERKPAIDRENYQHRDRIFNDHLYGI